MKKVFVVLGGIGLGIAVILTLFLVFLVLNRPAKMVPFESITAVNVPSGTLPAPAASPTIPPQSPDHPRMLAPTLTGDQLSPAWSPDGQRVVFVNENMESSRRSLYLFDLSSGAVSRLTDNPGTNDILPQFSPNGKRILYISQQLHDMRSTIMAMGTDSGSASPLSDGSDYIYEAAWAPDSAHIAYISNRGGKDRLWIVNADGSDPRDLTPALDGLRGPIWSPDSSFIAVTDWAAEGAYAEIHVIEPDTGKDVRVTDQRENANQAA